MSAHVSAPTPAAHIRAPKRPRALKVATVAAIVLGVALWVFVVLAAAGSFDKETVPESPDSVAHKMAVDLEEAGEIDSYRAVEPDSGWDVEYEVDGGDGYIRARGEGGFREEIEVYGYPDSLGDALEDEAEERGFTFGD